MDKKALLILNEYHKLFVDRRFLERDVLGFFIFIREHLSDTGVLKEISHFIAHRNRDRGETYTFAEKIDDALQNLSLKSTVLRNENLFYSPKEIQQELNDFFENHDLSKLNPTAITEIIMCLISLLQAVPITKKDGTKLCELELGILKDKVLLNASFNWPIDSSTAIPFIMSIMGISYATENFPESDACLTNPNTFVLVRENGNLKFK